MTASGPSSAFANIALDLTAIPAGSRYGRIFLARYPDPLGFGYAGTRFSDPRRRVERNRFAVIYLGASLKVCFLEAFLRDRRNGAIGDLPIAEAELRNRRHATVEATSALTLVDLRGDGPVRMGIPTDVLRGSRQTLARRWSVALHDHPLAPDGILYPSRLNNETNIALYHRAIPKLRLVTNYPLIAAPGLAAVLDDLRVAIAPTI